MDAREELFGALVLNNWTASQANEFIDAHEAAVQHEAAEKQRSWIKHEMGRLGIRSTPGAHRMVDLIDPRGSRS